TPPAPANTPAAAATAGWDKAAGGRPTRPPRTAGRHSPPRPASGSIPESRPLPAVPREGRLYRRRPALPAAPTKGEGTGPASVGGGARGRQEVGGAPAFGVHLEAQRHRRAARGRRGGLAAGQGAGAVVEVPDAIGEPAAAEEAIRTEQPLCRRHR